MHKTIKTVCKVNLFQKFEKNLKCFNYFLTNNLSKAHVTRDSSGPATLAISVAYGNKILMHLERVLKCEASVWKTA